MDAVQLALERRQTGRTRTGLMNGAVPAVQIISGNGGTVPENSRDRVLAQKS